MCVCIHFNFELLKREAKIIVIFFKEMLRLNTVQVKYLSF